MWPIIVLILIFNFCNAASVNINDYHESLLGFGDAKTEKPEIFLEELESRRIQRPIDSADDKEMKELVRQDMALQIRPGNVLTLDDDQNSDGGDGLRH